MRILKKEKEINAFLRRLEQRSSEPSEEIVASVQRIIKEVRRQGDRALIKYTKRFDKVELKKLRLSEKEIEKYAEQTPRAVVNSLKLAAKRIKHYHLKQLESSWHFKEKGILLGQMIRPLQRVGVYIPGGRASYPSTVLMNVIPAQVAGVQQIAVTVPTPYGEINPAVMAAIKLLDLKEVYTVGGAQAIAALAYGTESIKKVDKIVGPGNIYVAVAKKLVFGTVDIDMFAGPSEVLVIADSTAKPSFVAADMLSQAEHDELASSVCITTSDSIARQTLKELKTQLQLLPKKDIAKASLSSFGAIIVVKNLKEAALLANRIAPEHLELMVKDPEKLLKQIQNAGAIFLGQWTPEPLGDYIAGPNHTLPTSGTARFFSPLGVYDFLKRSSILKFDRNAFMQLAKSVVVLAEAESLQAHANSIKVRMNENE